MRTGKLLRPFCQTDGIESTFHVNFAPNFTASLSNAKPWFLQCETHLHAHFGHLSQPSYRSLNQHTLTDWNIRNERNIRNIGRSPKTGTTGYPKFLVRPLITEWAELNTLLGDPADEGCD